MTDAGTMCGGVSSLEMLTPMHLVSASVLLMWQCVEPVAAFPPFHGVELKCHLDTIICDMKQCLLPCMQQTELCSGGSHTCLALIIRLSVAH